MFSSAEEGLLQEIVKRLDLLGSGVALTPVNITYTELQTLLTNGTAYGLYFITDRGDTGMIVQAYGSRVFGDALAGFLNCDWAGVGDYSSIKQINYINGTGAFTIGETITDDITGATGIVGTDNGSTLILYNVVGDFNDNDTFTGGTSTETGEIDGVPTDGNPIGHWRNLISSITYDNLVGGPFTVGETVTGGTSGATGIVLSDNGTTVSLKYTEGTFINNEQITGGTSGTTADVDGSPVYPSFNPQIGDVAIFQNTGTKEWEHYLRVGGLPSSVYPDASAQWQVLPKNLTNGFIEEWDDVRINFAADTIITRKDVRENVVIVTSIGFPYGNPNCSYNEVNESVTISVLERGCFIIGNVFKANSNITLTESIINISYNTFYSTSILSVAQEIAVTIQRSIFNAGVIVDDSGGYDVNNVVFDPGYNIPLVASLSNVTV